MGPRTGAGGFGSGTELTLSHGLDASGTAILSTVDIDGLGPMIDNSQLLIA